ncbi:MAG: ABC transporter ATP-binding protein, partial [Acidobacteria bacterium]|nr:ABC transporter ATP-binding protein [Acidobacteriota bacterium]
RLSVVRALLHQPRVLLFDEPTHGLDPVAAASWRRYLREELVARLGCTVLVATHNLREAEEVCSRLAILHRGRMCAVGTQADVCRQAAASSLEEAYARLASATEPAQPAPAQ